MERRIRRDTEAMEARRRAQAQAEQRQRTVVERLRVSVAKQQQRVWDQVGKDAARRVAAERKVGVAQGKFDRAWQKREVAIRRGYKAGEEDALTRNIDVANGNLASAQRALAAIPEVVRRREDEAGSWRGRLFLVLRKLHALRAVDAPADEIGEEKRNVWRALYWLRTMYADSAVMQENDRTGGLAYYIFMYVQEAYDETQARTPNLTNNVIDQLLERTFEFDPWREGGRYNIDLPSGRHQYVDSSYAQLTRGLWIVDPLVPLPDEARAVQWPPHPQGAVPIPTEVSLWHRNGGDGVWRPDGLHAWPAPEPAPFHAAPADDGAMARRMGLEMDDGISLADLPAEMELNPSHRGALGLLRTNVVAVIEDRELRGQSERVSPDTMMMRLFVRDVETLVRRWNDWPTGDEMDNIKQRVDAFLAGVDTLELWGRLGGTEADVRRLLRDTFAYQPAQTN